MTTGQVQHPIDFKVAKKRPSEEGGKEASKAPARKYGPWFSTHARTVILLTLSFVGCFAVLIALKLAKDYQDTLLIAEKRAESTVGTIATEFRSHLLSAEALMDYAGLIHRYSSGRLLPVDESQTAALRERLATAPLVENLTIIDAKGLPVFSSTTSDTALGNQADSIPFKFHKKQTGNDLFVLGGQNFQISKRLTNNSGKFIGLAAISLKENYLKELADTATLEATLDLAISGRNGVILAASMPTDLRGGHIANLIGMPWPLPSPSADGTLVAYTQNIEEVRFLVAAREIRGTPFTFYVAQTVNDALAAWYGSLTLYLLMILAPTLFGAGVCGILVRQVMQRDAAIKARRASEARLNLAIDGARCGIWEWNLEQETVHWSPSMYAILGRVDGEPDIPFDDIRALMHPEDRGLLTEIIEGATRNQTSYDHSFRLRHAHGHWIWVHAKGQIQKHPGSLISGEEEESESAEKLPRLVGLAVDISAQKASEARVVEMEARLRDAIDNISESFVLWDSRNELVLCNQKFIEFYKIDPRRIRVGAPLEEVIASAELPIETITDSDDSIATGPNLSVDDDDNISELQHVGNRWIHVNTRHTGDGGKVSIGIDVTALKDQEDEILIGEEELTRHVSKLEESQKRLQKESAERAELAVKYASEKARAEEASRSKTEFLANMSHELRTPLNAIMGFAQIMSDGMFGTLGDKKYESYTRDILDSAQYLLALINDILDMSKIETGKLELEQENIALGHIMESCLRIVEPRAFEAGLRITYEPDTLLSVYADKRAVKQILLNLLSNAIKFTPRGGEIIMSAEINPNHAAIIIEDTGIGIAEKDLARIGKPFEQIESQSTKSHKGSGLGLALSKSLTELQGGTLTIESELGLGTQVCFTLPRNKPHQESDTADTTPHESEPAAAMSV